MKGKIFVAVAAIAFAAGLFAASATYNDLGDQSGTNTDFWNNTQHPVVAVDTSSAVLAFELDTWYKTEDWAIADIFTGQLGFLLFFH